MGSKGYKLNYCIIFYMDKKYINFYKKFILHTKTVSNSGISASSDLKGDNNGRINSNRTSHCNVGHSIGSSGKTYEKTPRQRNPQKGLVQGSNDDKRNHYSHLFSYGGVEQNRE